MIVFRDAASESLAKKIAQVMDEHELCVVSMVLKPDGRWLVVGQGQDIDDDRLDRDISQRN